jgi:hypothetical protein
MNPRPSVSLPAGISPKPHTGLAIAFFLTAGLAAHALDETPAPSPAVAPTAAQAPDGTVPGRRHPYALSGKYTVASETRTEGPLSIASDQPDVSAVFVTDGGNLTLTTPAIATTGGTSDQENSSCFGLNAAVLAANGGHIAIDGGTIATSGTGANAAFATGTGSTIALSNLRIEASGDSGHGVMVSAGGSIALQNVGVRTTGAHGAAVSTDRGGGTITATGGTLTTGGPASPAIYSTGAITIAGAKLKAASSEAAVIEGSNSITLKNSTLVGGQLCGAMIYQSFSGDARGQHGAFTMEGGSFSALDGPLFFVNNTHGTINLKGVSLEVSSGVLVNASAGRWGHKGRNGGHVVLFATHQLLVGDLRCDDISSIAVTLRQNSMLVGRIDTASLTLDATSTWEVVGDSTLAGLVLPAYAVSKDSISCIVGNGHTVGYDSGNPTNRWLGGKTYALAEGGQLVPLSQPLFKKRAEKSSAKSRE